MRNRHQSNGFTLIELLVVVTIILILAGLVLPSLDRAIGKAHYTRWRGFSHTMRTDDRLLAYYNFEDGNASTSMSNLSVGSGIDNYSTKNFHGTFSGTAKIDITKGRWNGKGATYFTGASTDYFYAPNAIYDNDGTMPITVMYWTYVKSSDLKDGSIFTLGNLNNPSRCQSHSPGASGTMSWDYGDCGTAQGRATAGLPRDDWVHVALVSEGSGGKLIGIYLNGNWAGGSASASMSPGTTLNGLYLGGCPVFGSTWFQKATIDEFSIHAKRLTQAEILRWYKMGKP